MILEAIFNKPKPVNQDTTHPAHTLVSIVATQAMGSVEEWERKRNEHNAKVERETARRVKLLPIERAGMPALVPHNEPLPVLCIAGMELPRIDKNYVCSAAKVFADGKRYPAFAIYDIDGSGTSTWETDEYGVQERPYNLSLDAIKDHIGEKTGRYLRRRSIHKFTGVIPDSARAKVQAIRASGELPQASGKFNGYYVGDKVPNIFLIEEAYAWSKPEIRNIDLLIVCEKDDAWYLVDKFDLTPMEEWLVQEFVG